MANVNSVSQSKGALAAVIEQLPDGVTCRAGLMKPQVARRLVKEYNDDGTSSVFESVPEAVLVDLPFRKLVFESRVLQRLYYGMDTSDDPSYAKRHISQNNLLLLDPIRLGACINKRLDSFFKMVSLGIGEKIRKLLARSTHPWLDDDFLYGLEDLQLELVQLRSRVETCESSADSAEDVANTIGEACSDVLTIAHKFDDDWGRVQETSSTIKRMCNYLSQQIAEVRNLFIPTAGSTNRMDANASAKDSDRTKAIKLFEISDRIAVFVLRTAFDLSVAKMKVMERRAELCQKPGAFSILEAEVFKHGIRTAEYAHDDIMQMLLLSHCVESYAVREWCARYFIETRLPLLGGMRNRFNLSGDSGTAKEESSPFFITAGAVSPDVSDFATLIPTSLSDYIREMIEKN
ncbi:hypothetical protein, conserved [Babesia bigemina]|uniref:Uncharacterized protein n=1 Tax=Babesia bigemina TaxID=5866 RepID=A0A061DAS0_BABBI|nr:hypothetical protein, conserved [Babesia bigemina]CDR96014.1 hypothetical protein, conserved [Babesia bigemina]|eukprot:XP_012768200.1 hypothetical protein, conserved [Babesia bigemina]